MSKSNKSSKKSQPSSLQFTCNLCNLVYNDEHNYKKHLVTDDHKDKMKDVTKSMGKVQKFFENEAYTCAICQVTCNGKAPYKAHLAGEKHWKKMTEVNPSTAKDATISPGLSNLSLEPKEPENTLKIKETPKILPSGQFKCEVCQVVCNSQEQYESHLSGVKHKKKANKNS